MASRRGKSLSSLVNSELMSLRLYSNKLTMKTKMSTISYSKLKKSCSILNLKKKLMIFNMQDYKKELRFLNNTSFHPPKSLLKSMPNKMQMLKKLMKSQENLLKA